MDVLINQVILLTPRHESCFLVIIVLMMMMLVVKLLVKTDILQSARPSEALALWD